MSLSWQAGRQGRRDWERGVSCVHYGWFAGLPAVPIRPCNASIMRGLRLGKGTWIVDIVSFGQKTVLFLRSG